MIGQNRIMDKKQIIEKLRKIVLFQGIKNDDKGWPSWLGSCPSDAAKQAIKSSLRVMREASSSS